MTRSPEVYFDMQTPVSPAAEADLTPNRAPDLGHRRIRPGLAWFGLVGIALLSIGAVAASVVLHRHAAQSRAIIQDLGEIETQATAQANVVWRGLTQLMAEERMPLATLRGEEQRARQAIREEVRAVVDRAEHGATVDRWLGFTPEPEHAEMLEAQADTFLAAVQGAMGQLQLSPERLRQRLRYWDLQFGGLAEAIDEMRAHEASVATAASRVAGRVTAAAAGGTLLAAALLTVQIARLRARRARDRRRFEAELRHQARHDPLTDLPNRRRLREHYETRLQDRPTDAAGPAVLFVDLDGFKRVNDSYGHRAGDRLLITAAARIGACLQADDLLARQGGDEFIVLTERDAAALAGALIEAFTPPFTLDGQEIFLSASVGVLPDAAGLDAEAAVQRADIAMYAAKRAGRARAVTFTEDLLGDAPDRLALEADLRRGLERGEFTVVYQPKVGLRSGVTESLEALVRWQHPQRGVVGPDRFIPLAEETGLIHTLGRVVLEQACRDAVRWQDRGVVVAVNLSPLQFRNPRLVDEVRKALTDSGLNPRLLELEITESAVLGDVTQTVAVLDALKALGVRLAIDDFGTGYSNLAHLKHFAVDVLKIDQAFVRGGGQTDAGDQLCDGAIVEAVIGMAKAFGLHVVAEGVETLCHVDQLRDLGADLGQGYYFSKPVDGEGIDAFLAAEERSDAA